MSLDEVRNAYETPTRPPKAGVRAAALYPSEDPSGMNVAMCLAIER